MLCTNPASQGHAGLGERPGSPRRGSSPPPPPLRLQVPAAPAASTSCRAAETPGRSQPRGARCAGAEPGREAGPAGGGGAGSAASPPPPPRGVSRKWPYWIHSAAAARAERVPQPARPCRGPGAPRNPPARCAARHGGHRLGTRLGEACGAQGHGRGLEVGCQHRAAGPRTPGHGSQPREGVSECWSSRSFELLSREEAKIWADQGRCEVRLVSRGEDPGRPRLLSPKVSLHLWGLAFAAQVLLSRSKE